jgi:predicted RNA-binding Zn-ribbon protein involved in translation (DUF1610 family)
MGDHIVYSTFVVTCVSENLQPIIHHLLLLQERIALMARDMPPVFACVKCGRPATQLCTYCSFEELAFDCDECGKEHRCGEYMMLPLVKSPRMGFALTAGKMIISTDSPAKMKRVNTWDFLPFHVYFKSEEAA